MKNIKKFTAAILAVAMLTVFAGCSGDQSWSYKTDNVSLSAGTYIYNLLNGYYAAYDLVESPDEVKDIVKAEVTDSDGDTKTVEQYSYDEADKDTLRMIAVEELFKNYGLELEQDEYDAALSYASQFWGSIKDSFESYGIAQSSFNYCYAEYTVKYGQVFEYLYGENGDEYVTDEALTEYFSDKYTGYAYFTLSMAETDEEGNSVTKSNEEFARAESDFTDYVDMIKDGSSYEDVVRKYAEDYELSTDPTYSGAVDLENNNLSEEVANALKDLKEGEAKYIVTGEDATTLYYFIYKPTTKSIVDFLDSDDSDSSVETPDTADSNIYIYPLKSGFTHYTLLNEMKGDAFDEYLDNYASSLSVSKNETVINKFKPKMFVSED